MTRILVLAPHPDDEAIGCGGVLLQHAEQGDTVQIIFLTSGEKGMRGISEDETIRIRENEAHRATKILGVRQAEFWRLPDGALQPTPVSVERMRHKLEAFQPDIIYVTHEREMHPDHRGAVRILRRAIRDLIGFHPDILGFEVWTPIQRLDEIRDITPFMETKIRAVRAYRSQCALVGFAEATRGLNRYRGEMHCWPGGNFAEAFTRLKS
jgi:LmbE family N-acetylglucosaminyl deacetylase